KSGPAIVLGKPAESLLIRKIHSGEMPPNKRLQEASVKPITSDETDKLARWIAAGAPEIDMQPDVATTAPDPLVADEDRRWWSFQPPRDQVPPTVKNVARISNPIDRFVLAKLESVGLDFAPEADPIALCRRLYYDLTGLPPTPEEMDDWEEKLKAESRKHAETQPSRDSAAFSSQLSAFDSQLSALVDKLLASPRYGERWGRYWLDAAGYADSEGKRSQDPVRPFAYRYRDYVIRAFNSDKPYDRFLLEQLAGDDLADFEHAPQLTPELLDNLIATGFMKMAPDGTGSNVVNFTPERLEVISDQLEIFGSTVLGLTLKCARCHSHKYDPIPQRDYFRIMACFKGALDEHDWLKPSQVAGQSKGALFGSRQIAMANTGEQQEVAAFNRQIDAEIARLKVTVDQPGGISAKELDKQIKKLEADKRPAPSIQAVWDRGEPSPTYMYRRGDYLSPGRLVGPGVLSALTDGQTPFQVEKPYPGATSTGRRLALARWVTSPDHPLTARVMVNRLWKHHFGVGIVKSLDNFGKMGVPPSHPELLDWLAKEFVRSGWSVKAMHRLLVTSSVYRQSSQWTPDRERLDPENQLLSRMPLTRLDAEALRDSLLYVAGKLDERRFGPPDNVTARPDGLMMPDEGLDGSYRRAIYVRHRRKEVPTILETFDLPQMNPNCIERTESTVAAQALHLMNNEQVHELSAAMAERVEREAPGSVEARLERAFRIAFSRAPLPAERSASRETFQKLVAAWSSQLKQVNEVAGDRNDHDAPEHKALVTFCHALVNSAGFLYVD
ncbi:MAG: DUF1553 domain-containing protein, partial [Planctomycetaceae bacterium]|nr:DUF1553 domain-containing protein [Planctomycetaceae bacterium]